MLWSCQLFRTYVIAWMALVGHMTHRAPSVHFIYQSRVLRCRRATDRTEGKITDKETNTRLGNKRPTRKQIPDKEASIRQGNKHPRRKQAPDKEANTRQGSKHPTRKQAPDKEASTRLGNKLPRKTHLFKKSLGGCRPPAVFPPEDTPF